MKTNDWKSLDDAKIVVVGHDPRLQVSDTIATYAFFADYYFKPEPKSGSEKRKYGLAKSAFEHILYLTNNKFTPEQIYITNLCNDALPHAPKNKTVLIPKDKAIDGISNIRQILTTNPSIEIIFPMSQQVNYWLQKLEFYAGRKEFVENSEPKTKGLINTPPYFEPKKGRAFKLVCGNQYKVVNNKQLVIPILHTKNFPLKHNFKTYEDCYQKITEYFR